MSTEYLKGILDSLHCDLVEYINDENLDILDVVSADDFAEQVIKIAQRIVFFKSDRPEKTIHGVIGNIKDGKIWNVKVSNSNAAWVSVSDDTNTGVSRSVYYAFYEDESGYYSGLCSLASMINEAWHHLNND